MPSLDAKSVLLVVHPGPDGRHSRIDPSGSVPAMSKEYEKLEQFLSEGYEITCIAKHPMPVARHRDTPMFIALARPSP
jgi:hypothetical protein